MSRTSDNGGNPNHGAPKANGIPGAQKAAIAPVKSTTPRTDPDLLTFKWCANDGSVHVKTISRWVKRGYLTEWRPHPKSRSRRIKREVWEAFKQRQ